MEINVTLADLTLALNLFTAIMLGRSATKFFQKRRWRRYGWFYLTFAFLLMWVGVLYSGTSGSKLFTDNDVPVIVRFAGNEIVFFAIAVVVFLVTARVVWWGKICNWLTRKVTAAVLRNPKLGKATIKIVNAQLKALGKEATAGNSTNGCNTNTGSTSANTNKQDDLNRMQLNLGAGAGAMAAVSVTTPQRFPVLPKPAQLGNFNLSAGSSTNNNTSTNSNSSSTRMPIYQQHQQQGHGKDG